MSYVALGLEGMQCGLCFVIDHVWLLLVMLTLLTLVDTHGNDLRKNDVCPWTDSKSPCAFVGIPGVTFVIGQAFISF